MNVGMNIGGAWELRVFIFLKSGLRYLYLYPCGTQAQGQQWIRLIVGANIHPGDVWWGGEFWNIFLPSICYSKQEF